MFDVSISLRIGGGGAVEQSKRDNDVLIINTALKPSISCIHDT